MAKTQVEGAPEAPKAVRRRTKDDPPRAIPFFKRVASIAKADWGTRAVIKVYRLEPVLNLLLAQDHKYVTIYEQDGWQFSEEHLKQSQGSGKYKAYLNFKEPAQGDKEIDSVVLDIYDQNYPPNIPMGTWVDHPKNKNWLWAKPLLKPAGAGTSTAPATTPLGEMAQMMTVMNDVQDSAVERARASIPVAPAQPNFLEIIQGVAAIMPKPQTATENTILTTVVSLMTSQLEAQRAESKELRDEIRSMRNGPQDKKSAFDMFREGLGLLKDLGPTVKEVLPGLAGLKGAAADAIGGSGRSRMSGWQEFAQPLVSDLLNNPVMSALGQLILIKSQQATAPQAAGNANPAMPAARPAIAPGQPKTLVDFFNSVWPSMLRYLKEDWAGDEFASWLMDGYGCPYLGIDWRGQAQLTGADNIITAFRTSPFWQQIVTLPNGEQKFIEFVHSFVQWDPNAEDKQDDGIEEGEVIDLTAGEQIANV